MRYRSGKRGKSRRKYALFIGALLPIPMPSRLFFFLAFDRDLFFQTC